MTAEPTILHCGKDMIPSFSGAMAVGAQQVLFRVHAKAADRSRHSRLVIAVRRCNSSGEGMVDGCSAPCQYEVGPQVGSDALYPHTTRLKATGTVRQGWKNDVEKNMRLIPGAKVRYDIEI